MLRIYLDHDSRDGPSDVNTVHVLKGLHLGSFSISLFFLPAFYFNLAGNRCFFLVHATSHFSSAPIGVHYFYKNLFFYKNVVAEIYQHAKNIPQAESRRTSLFC